MQQATALNVEGTLQPSKLSLPCCHVLNLCYLPGQLKELKGQMSKQLIDMAKGAERLLGERKILEHQIAELLTFKERFAEGIGREQFPSSYTSQPQTYANASPQRQPRRQQRQPSPEPVRVPLPGRYPDPTHPSWEAAPSAAAQGYSRPLPTPGIPRTGHLNVPPMGQRF